MKSVDDSRVSRENMCLSRMPVCVVCVVTHKFCSAGTLKTFSTLLGTCKENFLLESGETEKNIVVGLWNFLDGQLKATMSIILLPRNPHTVR